MSETHPPEKDPAEVFSRILESGEEGNPLEGLPAEERGAIGKALAALGFLKRHLEISERPKEAPEGIDPLRGRLEIGDYNLLELIGAGGMGIVYRAWQRSLRRAVALKILPLQLLARPSSRERFVAEARMASRLHHPNIVPVHSLEEVEGFLFFTMDYIPGTSLREILSALRQGDSPPVLSALLGPEAVRKIIPSSAGRPSFPADLGPSFPRAIGKIGRDLSLALDYAHQEGMVHRDIKPSNVLLDGEGKPYLCDFGLAKDLIAGESQTATADVLGTAAYAAPERLEEKGKRSDRRGDIYSLSLTLYELLTLHHPFLRPTVNATLRRIVDTEPPFPRRLNRHIPRDLETIVLRGIEKDPSRRYGDAAALAEDLDRFLSDRPLISGGSSSFRRARWFARRNRRKIAVLLAAAAALIAAAILAPPWISAELKSSALRRDMESSLDGIERDREKGLWKEALPRSEEVAKQASDSLVPGETKARAHFLLGHLQYFAKGSDPAEGLKTLAQAYRIDPVGKWASLAWLQLVEYGLLQGNLQAVRELVENIDEKQRARWPEVGAQASLLEIKRMVAERTYGEARGRLAALNLSSAPPHFLEEGMVLRRILEKDPARSFPLPKAGTKDPQIAIGQLDGSGPPEVIIAWRDLLTACRIEGDGLVPVAAEALGDDRDMLLSAVPADLDGDGKDEIILGFRDPSGDRYRLEGEVRKLEREREIPKIPGWTFSYVLTEQQFPFIHFIPPAGSRPPLLGIIAWKLPGGSIEFLQLRDGVLQRFDGWTIEGQSMRSTAKDRGDFLTQMAFFDLDGDGLKELILSSGGYRAGECGLKVYVDQGDGKFRCRAMDLVREKDGKRYADFDGCAADRIFGEGEPGFILGGRKGTVGNDSLNESPTFAFGGLAVYRFENAKTGEALLEPTCFRHLGIGIATRKILTAPLIPGGRSQAILKFSSDLSQGYLVLFFPQEWWPSGWFLPILFQEANAMKMDFAAGDLDGDNLSEIACAEESGGSWNLILFDLSGGGAGAR